MCFDYVNCAVDAIVGGCFCESLVVFIWWTLLLCCFVMFALNLLFVLLGDFVVGVFMFVFMWAFDLVTCLRVGASLLVVYCFVDCF